MRSNVTSFFTPAIIVALVTLTGCATVDSPALSYRSLSIPEVGHVQTQNLGEPLIYQLSSIVEPAIYPSGAIEFSDKASFVSSANKSYQIKPSIFRIYDTGRKSVKYLYSGSVLENGQRTELKACLHKRNENYKIELSDRPCGPSIVEAKSKDLSNVSFRDTTYTIIDERYFRQELIYNGRNNTSVRFIYREYFDNTARPAFTQSVEYDLSLSDEIGFMEARFRVIEASNTEITYEVLKGFADNAAL